MSFFSLLKLGNGHYLSAGGGGGGGGGGGFLGGLCLKLCPVGGGSIYIFDLFFWGGAKCI